MITTSYADLDTCGQAQGAVVVIDVIRAFTTAAYAFAAGATAILPVATVEQAFAHRQRDPEVVLMGEERGHRPAGFDYGNSPAALVGQDLGGRIVVQRTGFGTQGLVRCAQASPLLAASLVCAGATVRLLRAQGVRHVTLVRTGMAPEGEEDIACAEYIAALLGGRSPDPGPCIRRVRDSYAGRMFGTRPGFDPADLACCTQIDRWDVAMLAQPHNGRLVLHPVQPPA